MADAVKTPRPPLLIALAGVLFLECAGLAAATVFFLVELLTQRPASYGSAIAIVLLTGFAAIWVGVMAVHALAGRPWIRGGAVTWQVLQIAVAIGSFQGIFARPEIGWLLLIPAVAVLLLLLAPSVIRATKRPES